MTSHGFGYIAADGPALWLGDWHPAGPRPEVAVVHITRDRATAATWHAELHAGRLPDLPEPAPGPAPVQP